MSRPPARNFSHVELFAKYWWADGRVSQKIRSFSFWRYNTQIVKILKISWGEVSQLVRLYLLLLAGAKSLPSRRFFLIALSTTGGAGIKGEINFPLDWLTVQKAKLTWQSELDDSLSTELFSTRQGWQQGKLHPAATDWTQLLRQGGAKTRR